MNRLALANCFSIFLYKWVILMLQAIQLKNIKLYARKFLLFGMVSSTLFSYNLYGSEEDFYSDDDGFSLEEETNPYIEEATKDFRDI